MPVLKDASQKTRRDAHSLAAARLRQLQDLLVLLLDGQHPADAVLSRWMRANRNAGARDRSQLADAAFDVLRHLRRYRHMAQSGTGPLERRLAVLGLAGVLPAAELTQALSADERGWLAHANHIDPESLTPGLRFSLPDWLLSALQALPQAEALMAALNQPAPLDLRINPFKTSREAALQAMALAPCARPDATATPFSPWGIRLQGRPAVNRWPLFLQGEIEVQDEGSQLLAALVAPRRGEVVIDYCAGAGGKTLLLGALMQSSGRLFALDVSAPRLARARPRLARSGLSNVVPIVIRPRDDPRVRRLAGKAHRVLVDAPCSGTGTLRRNPDLKWRFQPQDLPGLLQEQAAILRDAARCVAAGGRLVYATCSLLPQENQMQIAAFLEAHPEFSLEDAPALLAERSPALHAQGPYLQLRPDTHGTDGFFAAVMKRH